MFSSVVKVALHCISFTKLFRNLFLCPIITSWMMSILFIQWALSEYPLYVRTFASYWRYKDEKELFSLCIRKNSASHGEIIPVGKMRASLKVLEKELGRCASIEDEVIYVCSLEDEPAFAWRRGEEQRERTLSGVGKRSPQVPSGWQIVSSLVFPVDSLVHAVAVDFDMLPLFISHQILI